MKHKLNWQSSVNGGWFCIDADGNYWHRSFNGEVITVTTPEGETGKGWTEETAWNNLLTSAA